MKKLLSVFVALILVLSMATAFAAPSKTTSDLTEVVALKSATGAALADTFAIKTAADTTMTLEEVEKLFKFVNDEKNAPIDFYPPEVQAKILEIVNENAPAAEVLVLDDLKTWEINEFVSVDAEGYDPAYGDVVATFEFATPYEIGQRMVAMVACYDGTRTEVEPNVFEFNAEWLPLKAEVVESVTVNGETTSRVDITFDQESIEKMQDGVANALAILSAPAAK